MENSDIDYKIVFLADEVGKVLDALEDARDYIERSPLAKELGIDIKADCKKYNICMETLYEKAKAQGILDQVIAELDEGRWYFEDLLEYDNNMEEQRKHEEIMYSVEVGDKVRLYNGNIRYVNDIDGNTLWVTPSRDTEQGWSAQLSDVVEILEKNNEW